jgi:PAS domain S-box-containing protein
LSEQPDPTPFFAKNVRKNGELFDARVDWNYIRNPQGQITGFVSIVTDISAQKQAEAELLENRRRLFTLMSNIPGMAYRCRNDAQWSMEFVSDGARQLTGYSAEDLIENRTVAYGDLIHPDDRRAVWERVQEGLRTRRPFKLEYRIFTAQGEQKWVWEQGVGVYADGRFQALEGLIADINERKRIELALQRSQYELEQRVQQRTAELRQANEQLTVSEAKYRALVETSPDPVVLCDLEGQILFASAQAASQLAIQDASLLVGRSVMELVVESERPLMVANIRSLLESGIRWNDEYTGLRNDGATFYAEASAAIVHSVSGEPVGFMAVVRDITDRKQAQLALADEQDALRRMLQASDRDRELITYEIHDGIAQRLAAALLQFEAHRRRVAERSELPTTDVDQAMATVRQASGEARGLMNRTRTPVLKRFGLRAAIADIIDQLGNRPDAPEIMYHCDAQFERLEPTLENSIFRVAQEAITNACLHSRSDTVRVSLTRHGEELTVEVVDRGIGFDTAEIEENRFGLDGIRERTRLLGTALEIESHPGQGTRIRATFPLVHLDDQTGEVS